MRWSPSSASDWRGRMRRTFLRCSLRQQQPWPGSRRFDDLCDPSHCHGFIGPSDSFALDHKAFPGNSVVSIRARTPGRERALPSKRTFRGPSSEEPEQRFFGVLEAASADQAVLLFRGCLLACQDEATRRASVKSRPADGPTDSAKGGRSQSDFLGRNMGADLGQNAR